MDEWIIVYLGFCFPCGIVSNFVDSVGISSGKGVLGRDMEFTMWVLLPIQ